jgi:hypothetical protein
MVITIFLILDTKLTFIVFKDFANII